MNNRHFSKTFCVSTSTSTCVAVYSIRGHWLAHCLLLLVTPSNYLKFNHRWRGIIRFSAIFSQSLKFSQLLRKVQSTCMSLTITIDLLAPNIVLTLNHYRFSVLEWKSYAAMACTNGTSDRFGYGCTNRLPLLGFGYSYSFFQKQ